MLLIFKCTYADNGNVGFGNIGDNSAKVWISGNLKVNSSTYSSDIRFKENVKKLNSSLDDILKLKTYQYTFVQDKEDVQNDSLSVNVAKTNFAKYNFDKELHFGLMAQDVERIFLVNLVSKDESGYLSLNSQNLFLFLLMRARDRMRKLKS